MARVTSAPMAKKSPIKVSKGSDFRESRRIAYAN